MISNEIFAGAYPKTKKVIKVLKFMDSPRQNAEQIITHYCNCQKCNPPPPVTSFCTADIDYDTNLVVDTLQKVYFVLSFPS